MREAVGKTWHGSITICRWIAILSANTNMWVFSLLMYQQRSMYLRGSGWIDCITYIPNAWDGCDFINKSELLPSAVVVVVVTKIRFDQPNVDSLLHSKCVLQTLCDGVRRWCRNEDRCIDAIWGYCGHRIGRFWCCCRLLDTHRGFAMMYVKHAHTIHITPPLSLFHILPFRTRLRWWFDALMTVLSYLAGVSSDACHHHTTTIAHYHFVVEFAAFVFELAEPVDNHIAT